MTPNIIPNGMIRKKQTAPATWINERRGEKFFEEGIMGCYT
jgi:hypothetical protein